MSVRSAHGFVPPLQFIEIMSFTSMLVVSSSIVGEDECSQKYAIKSNVPWPVSIEWRCSSKNIDQDRMLYSLWIWLLLWFIYRIYSIFDKSIFWMKRASKKNSQTLDSFSFPFSWTEYFIYISLFYRTHAWHNFCYIHCWCIFLLLLLLHSFYDFLSISEINNDKTWMNESKWLSVISLLYNFCVK